MSNDQFVYLKPYKVTKYTKLSTVVFGAVFFGGLMMNMLQSQIATYNLVHDFAVTTGTKPEIAANAPGGFRPFSAAGYFVHNSSILIGGWIMGFSIIGPFYILYQNAMNIAGFFSTAITLIIAGDPRGWSMVGFIIPHGIIEIPAILIGSGLGLYLAHLMYESLQEGRTINVKRGVLETVPYVLGVLVMLGIAAVIESQFSPWFAEQVALTLG